MRAVTKLIAASAALLLFAISVAPTAAGVTPPAIYVDGVLYRTVGTPTDFSNTGAPDHSFDTIWEFSGNQKNVAEVAPGDPGFNGGRWMVRLLVFNTDYATTLAAHDADNNGVLDSDEEVKAALADLGPAGATDNEVVKYFECPLIKVPSKGKP